jgi:hypothetical protein
MLEVLLRLTELCDGVRCDMAMLVMHDVFLRTWGGAFRPHGTEFWPGAIRQVQKIHPGFLLLAEVYWDLESELQQHGFTFTYDKRLYDRLLEGDAQAVRRHLGASLDYQSRLARFVENHDEQRSAAAFGAERSRAAATIALTSPGLRLVHEGQLEGWRTKVPVQLGRRPLKPPDPLTVEFYRRLLAALRHPVFHAGEWRSLVAEEAWAGNPGHDGFVAHWWSLGRECRLVAVNLSPHRGQCYLRLADPVETGRVWCLADLLSDTEYVRDGDSLLGRGLYLDMPGHSYHLFACLPA